MRIVIPLLNLSLSGGVRIALQYAKGLADRGHEVIVLIPQKTNEGYLRLPENIRLLKSAGPPLPLTRTGYLGILFALAKALPPCDVILATSWQVTFAVSPRFRHSNRLFYLIQHDDAVINSERSLIPRLLNTILYQVAYRSTSTKIVVSKWLQRVLLDKYGQTTVVVSNGVDSSVFSNGLQKAWAPPADRFDILCLGKMAHWKGFADVISALRILCTRNTNVRLVVATREVLNVPPDLPIVVVHPRDDRHLGELYRACSVFVFPSWAEGFGLPPLEAMACGAPVITTACGGVEDFACHNDNCLVVPPKSPEALAAAIDALRTDEALARRVSKRGLETATQFTMTRAVARLEEVLGDRLLG
jgi:glycosyltransferase involved in cell wall biosynthesis